MADAFGVEREISKAKGMGKDANYALRRLQHYYGGRVRAGQAQVNNGNVTPPRGWNAPGHRPSKKTRKAAKARWKAESKAPQQAQETTTKAPKTVKTGSMWSNPWVKGAAVAGGGAAAGGLGYTLYADSKKD